MLRAYKICLTFEYCWERCKAFLPLGQYVSHEIEGGSDREGESERVRE